MSATRPVGGAVFVGCLSTVAVVSGGVVMSIAMSAMSRRGGAGEVRGVPRLVSPRVSLGFWAGWCYFGA